MSGSTGTTERDVPDPDGADELEGEVIKFRPVGSELAGSAEYPRVRAREGMSLVLQPVPNAASGLGSAPRPNAR